MRIEFENSAFPLTILSLGTEQKRDIKNDTVLHHFIEACQSAKMVIDGPSILGLEVDAIGQEGCRLILQQLQNEPVQNTPLIINFTGFSRGGIVNLYIVNYLQQHLQMLEDKLERTIPEDHLLKQFERLQINIFNLEPVAGIGAKSQAFARVIPKIVNQYVAILQLDEMRREFKPQDLSRMILESSKDTKVCLLPLYGNHSNAMKIKSHERRSAPLLYEGMLYHFLHQHQTSLNFSPPIKSPHEMLEAYSRHHQERASYYQYGKRMKLFDSSMFRTPRKMNRQIEYYVDEPDIFVNQCEKELLKYCYPNAFHMLFEHNINVIDVQHAIDDCKNIQEKIPELWTRLITHCPNIQLNNHEIHHITPSGSHHAIPYKVLPMLFNDIPENEPDDVLQRLIADVRHMTLRYEREKSDLFPFHRRPLAQTAQAIRDEITKLCYQHQDNLYTAIINILQTTSHHFKMAEHPNDLMRMIDNLLSSYNESIPETPEFLLNIDVFLIQLLMNSLYYLIDFIGNFGYIGGFLLSLSGIFLHDMATRILDVSQPRIYLWPLIPLAFCIQQFGLLLKSHFGFKSTIENLEYNILQIRDEWIQDIREEEKAEEEPELDSPYCLHG